MKDQPEPLDSVTASYPGNLLMDQLRLDTPPAERNQLQWSTVSSSTAQMLPLFTSFFPHDDAVKLPCPLHSLGRRQRLLEPK